MSSAQVARSIAGVTVGYVVFVAGAWFAQEVVVGGVSYADREAVLLAGLFTPPTAVLGGFLTAAIAQIRPLLHVIPMCLLVAVETTYLYAMGRVDGPLWFEAMAGGSLIVAAIIGALGWRWLSRRAEANPRAVRS